MLPQLCFTLVSLSLTQAAVQPHEPRDLAAREAREKHLTALLQARFQMLKDRQTVGHTNFFLGKGSSRKEVASTTAQPLDVAVQPEVISPSYMKRAEKIIDRAGLSTPVPSAAYVNLPLVAATPMPFQRVMEAASQPLETKIGSAVIYGISGRVTPTPPPKQAAVSQQFVAQCPMVLFNNHISIRGQTCGAEEGRWVDPSALADPNRTVLRWKPKAPGGLFLGVDSALTGPGSAGFAEIHQEITLTGYRFSLRNCLGVVRYILEENVYKIDNMGQVDSTMEYHDIMMNAVNYMMKYVIRLPTGTVVAESTLFRINHHQVNFTEVRSGRSTGRILGVATRQGDWQGAGWQKCMSPRSPRGWNITFPDDNARSLTPATAQDIRVAIASSITLMGYRDETRGQDGLNEEGTSREMAVLIGGLMLLVFLAILICNCVMVFKASGLQWKIRKILFESEGAFLPKRPYQLQTPPLHPAY